MRYIAICLLLVVIATIDIVIAEDQSLPDGTIYGHVYDAQTKQPISGVWVYCQETKCPKQLTDSDGYYAIESCFSPSSNYVIECTKNGYPTAKNTAETDSRGKANVDLNLGQAELPTPTKGASWNKTFGGSSYDSGHSVQQTDDGGYVIIGETNSYGAGGSDAWLIKTDSNGNKLWDRTFGGSDYDWGYSIKQTTDSGYILAGCTYSYGHGRDDVWLIKTDPIGNKQWDKTFGGPWGSDKGYSVQQINDGGYVICGYTDNHHTRGNYDPVNGAWFIDDEVWLIKTDSQGNEQWNRTFGGPKDDVGHMVQRTSDGGYIIVGETESLGAGGEDIWLIKTDVQGNEQWNRTFGGSKNDEAKAVLQTSDGDYIVVGYTQSFSADASYSTWLIKTDAEGNKLWDKFFRGIGAHESVQQTSDGGYIIAGPQLIKTDSQGNEQWTRDFIRTIYSVQETRNGGYIIVAETGPDIWLIKTDSEGN